MICYTSTKCQKNHKVGQVELSWHLYNFRLGFMFFFSGKIQSTRYSSKPFFCWSELGIRGRWSFLRLNMDKNRCPFHPSRQANKERTAILNEQVFADEMETGGLKRIISTYQAQTPVGNKTGHPVYIAIQLGLFKISNLGTELLFTIEQLHSY